METNRQERVLTVAETILQQLGGNRFLRMTGAKHLTSRSNSLSMRIASVNYERKRVNGVVITLDPSDTYTVEAIFMTVKGRNVVGTRTDVYFDALQDVFTELTGLHTHL